MKRGIFGRKFLIIITLILVVAIYINRTFKPLSEEKRNISTTDIKMLAKISGTTNSTPIIRTYTEEEFNNFSENELKKIKKIVRGKIEGDIPALQLENGAGIIDVSFE